VPALFVSFTQARASGAFSFEKVFSQRSINSEKALLLADADPFLRTKIDGNIDVFLIIAEFQYAPAPALRLSRLAFLAHTL
jgi:hypothetical protein